MPAADDLGRESLPPHRRQLHYAVTTRVVFDVDETLVATAALAREAYATAGVDVPPGTLGTPWREWLPALAGGVVQAKLVHGRKRVAFAELLDRHDLRRLPAGDLAAELLPTRVATAALTAADYDTARRVLNAVGLHDLPLLASRISAADRTAILQTYGESGVYLDDRAETCELVASQTRWYPLWVNETTTLETLWATLNSWSH
jgi:hypothetical protein